MAATSACWIGWWLLCAAGAQAEAQDAESRFLKAYYLEVEERRLEEAAALYDDVARAADAPPELRRKAERRLAGLRGRARVEDLARLMPPDPLAYLEIRGPGTHLESLLEMIGLTAESAGGEGEGAGMPSPPLTVSPRLIEALKRFEGAALAVTDVDTRRGLPMGVLAIDPGRSDLIHGLIETALSSAAASGVLRIAEPIGGHAAYESPFATVVVTGELVIAGNLREEVVAAVERLRGERAESLAAGAELAEVRRESGPAMLLAYVNARRVLAEARRQLSRGGQDPEEYRILQAVADVESIRWVALQAGVGEKGLTGDLWLRLDEGHRSLAYNLLRTPPLGREALQAVPRGTAGLLAFALAESKEGGAATAGGTANAVRYITGLDLGREIFANIKEVMLFALPSPEGAAGQAARAAPDLAAVLTVKDPAKSELLWKSLLGVPAAIFKAQPEPVQIESAAGREVQVYSFPQSVKVYLAALPDRIILASSRHAMTQALGAGAAESILDDPGFATVSGRITGDSSKVILLHAARLLEVVQPFAGIDKAQALHLSKFLGDATVALVTDETPVRLRASIACKLPKVGPLLQLFAPKHFQEARAAPPRASRRSGR
jgi:hypothetical protein